MYENVSYTRGSTGWEERSMIEEIMRERISGPKGLTQAERVRAGYDQYPMLLMERPAAYIAMGAAALAVFAGVHAYMHVHEGPATHMVQLQSGENQDVSPLPPVVAQLPVPDEYHAPARDMAPTTPSPLEQSK